MIILMHYLARIPLWYYSLTVLLQCQPDGILAIPKFQPFLIRLIGLRLIHFSFKVVVTCIRSCILNVEKNAVVVEKIGIRQELETPKIYPFLFIWHI